MALSVLGKFVICCKLSRFSLRQNTWYFSAFANTPSYYHNLLTDCAQDFGGHHLATKLIFRTLKY